MNRELIKLAYGMGRRFSMEKRGGVIGRLLNLLVAKPGKAVLKAVLDPVLGLSQAGTNAEIRRRTGKWTRDIAGSLTIPASGSLPEKIISLGPESVHLYHRPAAVLHHAFISGPNASLNRLAAGSATLGAGGTLGYQKVLQRIDENRGKKRKGKKHGIFG